uniref:Uncharacterized protein n=1 Tax=Arundo donax TaxID=35708 RepID=A0A0A9FKD9_ARUDO
MVSQWESSHYVCSAFLSILFKIVVKSESK